LAWIADISTVTSQTIRPSAVRPVIGFGLMLALLALTAGGKAVLYDTLDPDCFWHMKVAEQIAREGGIVHPLVDHLSFASSPKPWTPYSWLAELGMKRLWDIGGYRAAVAAQAAMQALFIVFLGLGALELSGDRNIQPRYLASVVATAAGAFIAMPYLSFRPVTFALMLLAACSWLLIRDRRMEPRSRAVWMVVPITILLANVHLFAALVPLAVLMLWLGTWIERRGIRRYGVLFILTTLAAAATSLLPGVIAQAVRYGTADPMVASGMIAEMQPFYLGTMGRISAALAATVLLCAIVQRRKLRIGEWAALFAATLLLLRLGRFAPVFAIVATPVLATTLPALSDRLLARPATWALMLLILLVGGIRIASAFPQSNRPMADWLNRHGPDGPTYPCGAADFVSSHVRPHSGRLITEFTWGGYLEWRLGDRYQLLLDGRTQVFEPAFWQATYLGTADQRRDILATSHADAAILPRQKSTFRQLLIDLGWVTTYSDQTSEVLEPAHPQESPDPAQKIACSIPDHRT
jgi:hypothetical protein